MNYIVGPLLFLWLSWSIYQQIQQQTDFKKSWQIILATINGPERWKLGLVFILMLMNWGFEARKWQIQVAQIQEISFLYSFKSVMAGQAMGFNTINRIGESVARAAFLNDGNRMRGVALSIVGNMAQIIVTFAMGTLALFYLRWNIIDAKIQIKGIPLWWLDGLSSLVLVGVSLFTLAYFKIAGLIELLQRVPFIKKYKFYFEKLEEFQTTTLVSLLGLSLVRYIVFLVQYYLLLEVFAVNLYWVDVFSLVGVMFLILGIVPTIAMAELGIRGQLSLILLGLVSSNAIGILVSAAGIWLINLILPAIAGTLFILGIRIFRNK